MKLETTTTNAANRPASAAGFTLIELMVVIAILGLLLGLVAPKAWNALRRGNVITAKAQIQNFENAIGQYRSAHSGKVPDSLDVLLQPDPDNLNETYLDDLPDDPWGTPYEYKKLSNTKYEIISLGADGVPGGEGEDMDLSSDRSKQTGS